MSKKNTNSLIEYAKRMKAGGRKQRELSPHLSALEDEAIHIMREVIASFKNPGMLYSIGKDSSVMLHLALKAFYPSKLSFPLLHIDSTWKFKEMITFRNELAKLLELDLHVYINEEGRSKNISPFDGGSSLHTEVMKTDALKQALDIHKFDAAFGGARRDEEKSRAKERIFSVRNPSHGWDPRNQRPEIWNIFNTRKDENETMRVFPLSNWTELDIWQYIQQEEIPIVPLYFAKKRPVIERHGKLLMIDDERVRFLPNESPSIRVVRFRTLGCYPLTAATDSPAKTLEEIINEVATANTSEREGRLIDNDEAASMERKKRQGYF